MLRAQVALHHPWDVSRLPATSPHLLDLPAEIGANQGGYQSRRFVRPSPDPVRPPPGQEGQPLLAVRTLAAVESIEHGPELSFDLSDQIGTTSGARIPVPGTLDVHVALLRRLQPVTDTFAASSSHDPPRPLSTDTITTVASHNRRWPLNS